MPLTTCPGCGPEVSADALARIHCGRATGTVSTGWRGHAGVGAEILALAVIGTAPWLLYLYLFRGSRHP